VADRNPYVIGVPLTESAAFYGRQEFFKFIGDVLDAAKQNVIVLYGQRRIGKTSVLHRAAKWLGADGAFFPVYYDLQGKERLNLSEVLENLAQTLARRLELPRPDPERFDDDGIYFRDEFLPQAFKRLGETRLVLLMDEFDVLSDELESTRAASKTLFPYLQDLIVTRPQIGFVFVVGRRIEELATHFQAIFKQAVYRRVGHLQPEESRELIVEPARGMIAYTDDGVRAIQELAAGHPYFTQLICFEAFNAVKDGSRQVTEEVVQLAVSRAIESGHGALNWFWEGLPRAERFILSAVAQASGESGVASKDGVRRLLEEYRIMLSGFELNDAPDRLVEWEMLRHEGSDAYGFVVEIVRRWVIAEHPLSSARRDIDYVSKRAVRLFENARDAHSEGDLPYARDEYRRTLKANPNHSGAQLGLALVLFELGELDEAIAEFQRAYAIDEMSARDGLIRARLAKAQALEEQQQFDGAIAQYEQVLQLAGPEETAIGRLGAIWQERGEAALVAGDLTAATALYEKALTLVPGDAQLASRLEAARNRLEEKKNVHLIFQKALVAHQAGEMERAREGYKKLIQMDVLSYEGKNIASLLADTVAAPRPSPQPHASAEPKPAPDPEVQSAEIPSEGPASFPQQVRQPEKTKSGAGGIVTIMVLGGLALIGFLSVPASVSSIDLPATASLAAGETLQLSPSVRYDSTWRNKTEPKVSDYSWQSSDPSIATVADGKVAAVAAGTASITASYRGLTDETALTVETWDIPPIRGNVTKVLFFMDPSSDAQKLAPEHNYGTRFAAKEPGTIYTTIKVDLARKLGRETKVDLTYALIRSDESVAEEYAFVLTVQSSWEALEKTLRLDFDRRPGTYRLEYRYDNKPIGSGTFVVN